MNQIYLVKIVKAGRTAYQFSVYDSEAQAEHLARVVKEKLGAFHGGNDWTSEVTRIPYVHSMTQDQRIIEEALAHAIV